MKVILCMLAFYAVMAVINFICYYWIDKRSILEDAFDSPCL